ncbi:hypothetical protein ACFOON_04085 [Novosphingobium piscinae]|uniref:Uncharacterized protein n=1 Tax=Novosphingobium piscinae TaxID=1507448 RepID=A0A7X1G091_9SPHN|nr:hypothetical protein [Novosphingobium piscinae]MBC2670264.1 hypothetical protein [Novosphingobium piscinae]
MPHRGGAGRFFLALAPLLALAACEKADNEPGPGGVTMGEARALDRAAAMIEDQAPPGPGPSPAATGTAPH